MVRAARAVLPVRHRDLHGDPLLASPQGRRHQWAAVREGDAMTEIPEHLLKRAEGRARRPPPGRRRAEPPRRVRRRRPSGRRRRRADSRIPAHLLERSRAAKRRPRAAVRPRRRAAAASPSPTASPSVVPRRAGRRRRPVGAGPGGHTQRLLTVVKSGSIQDVKATPVDKVHTWPHLLAAEFVAALACLLFTFLFSIFVNAPLLAALQPQPDAEPVEGAVVLPRSARAADDVPPDGRRRDHPRRRPDRADLRPVHRQEPVATSPRTASSRSR